MTDDEIGTAAEIADALGVTAKRISDFGGAGKLRPHGRTIEGRKLYRLGEVRAMLAARPEVVDDPGLLTALEIATTLDRSPNTVMGWIIAGVLPAAGTKKGARGKWLNAYRIEDARRADATRGRAKDAAAPRTRTLATSTEPTATRPGSEDRVRIYEERVERGLAVFHPRDSRLDQGAA